MATRSIFVVFGRRHDTPEASSLQIGAGLDFSFDMLQRDMRRLGLAPSEQGLDLLTIGLAVYVADVSTKRVDFGDDGWTRHLDVVVEVQSPDIWDALTPVLVRGLNFVSSDRWRFRFEPRLASAADLGFAPRSGAHFDTSRISLLSGGLDSGIGAIDMLSDGSSLLTASISSTDTRTVGGPQNRLRAIFETEFDRAFASMKLSFRAPRKMRSDDPEPSQRARSFLFLSFASFLASCYAARMEVYVPENGLIALNVPLNSNRMASNSTKTAHPYFLRRFAEVLQGSGIDVVIREPYRFRTKGEMIRESANSQIMERVLRASVSCAKPPTREGTAANHCGCCPACIIRRAAIRAGYYGADPTDYHNVPDLFAHPLDANAKEGKDIRVFKAAAQRSVDHPEFANVDIYRSGPMVDVHYHIDDYIAVYKRGMEEVHSLLAAVQTRG